MKKLLLLLLFPLLFVGCTAPDDTLKPVEKSAFILNTIATITIYDAESMEQADDLIARCFDLCTAYENKLSRTISGSEIDQINHAGTTPVSVSPDTAALIAEALEYGRLSDGRFDITIAPISSLWDFQSDAKAPPAPEEIEKALPFVDYQAVQVDGTQVSFRKESAALDLGGIAKGFIADQAAAFLKQEGVRSAIINLGGNILVVGAKPDGADFGIGIQKPFDTNHAIIGAVSVKDQSVVTSGIYQRYFEYEDTLYHHILDPKTGYPVKNNLLSVTIISETSAQGDALSTTCFLLGLEQGMALLETLDDTEGIFITDDNKAHFTSGINQTIPYTPY